MSVHILIGSGTWGHAFSIDQVREQLESLDKLQCRQVDTAALYPFTSPGDAERFLGELGHKDLLVDTKAMWYDNGDNTLTLDAVQKSIDKSLERLKASKVREARPTHDHKTDSSRSTSSTPSAPTTKHPWRSKPPRWMPSIARENAPRLDCATIRRKPLQSFWTSAIEKVMSNRVPSKASTIFSAETYETTLLPILRKHNIAFMAYSALAGGMLSGKVTLFNNDPEVLRGTHFEVSEDNLMGLRGRSWYDKPSFHRAIRQLAALCETHGVDMVQASLRWILHHSTLDGGLGDGVIIGPRNQQQLDAYAAGIHGGPLPEALVKGINDLWAGVSDDAALILVY